MTPPDAATAPEQKSETTVGLLATLASWLTRQELSAVLLIFVLGGIGYLAYYGMPQTVERINKGHAEARQEFRDMHREDVERFTRLEERLFGVHKDSLDVQRDMLVELKKLQDSHVGAAPR